MSVSQAQANSDLAVYGSGTPTQVEFALATALPINTGNGSFFEPTTAQYAGYARVIVNNTSGLWAAASAGAVSTSAAVTFPTSTGGASSPVVVTNLVIIDHSNGHVMDVLALPNSTTIAAGQALSFLAGSITVREA